jgi:hypothetical protein
MWRIYTRPLPPRDTGDLGAAAGLPAAAALGQDCHAWWPCRRYMSQLLLPLTTTAVLLLTRAAAVPPPSPPPPLVRRAGSTMKQAEPSLAGDAGSRPSAAAETGAPAAVDSTVRAASGRLSALSDFRCKSVLYGDFVWARRGQGA